MRCENRRKAKIEKLRKALVKRIGSGSMRASFAGLEVRALDDDQAEERIAETILQPPHDCASVHGEGDSVEHKASMKAVDDGWINVSAPCMPIHISVDSNQPEHRHFIADCDFPFNLLVAEPITRTHTESKFPRRRLPVIKNGRNYSRDPPGTCSRFVWGSLLQMSPDGLELKCMKLTCLKCALPMARNLMTRIPEKLSPEELCSMDRG